MNCHTSGQSMPIPNATVATTTRKWEASTNSLAMLSLTIVSVQLWYMSMTWNCGRSGASCGSVKSSLRKLRKNTYRSPQSPSRRQYNYYCAGKDKAFSL